MALRRLMLQKQLEKAKADRSALDAKKEDIQKREKELEAAINELNEKSAEEERSTVTEAVEALEKEKRENDDAVKELDSKIEEIEKDIQKETDAQEESEEEDKGNDENKDEERKGNKGMITRTLFNLNMDQTEKFLRDERTKQFVSEVRSFISESRSVKGAELTIPDNVLPLIRQKVYASSKVLPYVYFQTLKGTGRQTIMGEVPMAIWTEMTDALNELDLTFNNIEVDGYKLGGYISEPRSIIEDSDIDLVDIIITALSEAIAKALDKAIIYGTGVKQPLGIVTRLAQAEKPADYSATAREWVNLSTTNVLTGTGKTGLALFKEIMGFFAAADSKYADNAVFFMNKKTHMKLMAESMDKNANASIVAGINNQMPFVGGDIVELEFIPDDNVVAGYGKAYLLVQRAGIRLENSDHAHFIEDERVFKGVARYDGKPAIAESFVAFTISTAAPTTAVA